MRARTIGLGLAVVACVAVAGWRVAQWTVPGRGVLHVDVYPQSTIPLPAGSYALRLPPGDWRPRTLAPGVAPVLELPVRLVFAPAGVSGDTTRYEALYLAPGGARSPRHRTVVLAESPAGNAWKQRAAALTRTGQWCLVVALTSPAPPDDSLTALLVTAARLAE